MSRPTPPTLARQLSIPDVAQELGVSITSVRRWINSGQLKAHRFGPRLIRVDERDLLKFRKRVTSLEVA